VDDFELIKGTEIMNEMKVELGDLAKDTITGFIGVVKYHSKYMHNCDAFGLQPQDLKDGVPIDVKQFDAPGVVVCKKKVVDVMPAAPMTFNFGDVVSDTLSDFKGIVTAYSAWVSGCNRVGVQASKLKDGNPVDWTWLPMSQLKLVKAAKKVTTPLTEGTVRHEKKPGGPMQAPTGTKAPR